MVEALIIGGLIAAAVAVGTFVAYAVVVTIRWFKNKIKEMLGKKNVKKVAFANVSKLVNECDNEISLDDLENYDNVAVSINDNGEVEDLEFIEDTGSGDSQVDSLLAKGDGMVVVTR